MERESVTMTTATIRLATAEDDARQIADIYAPFVRETAISFEMEPPAEAEMWRHIVSILESLPWLVCERAGEIWGYAYASPHRTRAAYQWAVDVAVYVRETHHRAGVGRALYTSLFAVLTLQNFRTACAGVTLPNPASVGLHEAMGFLAVGVYPNVGYKLGRWHDVGWWARPLQAYVDAPAAPISLPAVVRTDAFQAALASGLPLLHT